MTKVQIRKVVRRARQLLASEENWTREVNARDEDGQICDELDDAAYQFCLHGALLRGLHDYKLCDLHDEKVEDNSVIAAVRKHVPRAYRRSIAKFNDDEQTTHHRVLGVLDSTLRALVPKHRSKEAA